MRRPSNSEPTAARVPGGRRPGAMAILMRPCPVLVSLVAVVALCFSVFLVVGAFVEERLPDLKAATFETFHDERTCVETVTTKLLESRNYHDYDACDGAWPNGYAPAELGRLASVSVHPLVYAWQNHLARNVSNRITLQFLLPTILVPEAEWKNVRNNRDDTGHVRFQDRSNPEDAGLVNAQHLYHAVSSIPHAHVPSKDGCRATYPGAVFNKEYERRVMLTYNGSEPHEDYETQVPVYDLSEQVTCDVFPSPNLLNDGADTDGKLFSAFATTDTGPDASVGDGTCNPGASTNNKVTDGDLCLQPAQLNLLYTHCVLQFRFLGSGARQPAAIMPDGTFGLPNILESPIGPLDVVKALDGFHEPGYGLDDYGVRVRLVLGQRFGGAVFTYTLLLAVCTFLLADALFFLLAEATFPERLLATFKGSFSSEGRLRDLYRIRATSQFIRGERLVLAVVAFVVLLVVWLARLRLKWGDIGSRKFECTTPLTADEEDESHTTTFYRLTSGGWKSDHLAAEYENWAVIFALSATVLLPVARQLSFFDGILKSVIETTAELITASGGGGSGDVSSGALEGSGPVQKTKQSWLPAPGRVAMMTTVHLCGIGAVLVGILGQAGMAATFGTAWAQSIIGFHPRHTTAYDTVELYRALFNQCLATGAVAMATSWTAAALLNGLLVQGIGLPTWIFYGIWFVVALFGLLPLLLYMDVIPTEDKDCKKFFWDETKSDGDGGWHDEASAESYACVARTVTYVFAVLFIAIGLILLLAFLLFRIYKTGNNGEEPLNVQDETAKEATRSKINSATLSNKGKLILNSDASADPSSVVVSGFGVNGASVPHKRSGARPQLSFTGISRGSGRTVAAAGAALEAVPSATERHQERLAALLTAPAGQAVHSVPLQAVSRR